MQKTDQIYDVSELPPCPWDVEGFIARIPPEGMRAVRMFANARRRELEEEDSGSGPAATDGPALPRS